ncbi:MAG: UTRA domain-containing protein, partial [Rhodobacteraceae bacterium]|nr:UTRA domain-containing protein [Paracoccaceae bacterium]
GYLVRRRKLGTFVAAPRTQSAALAINDIEADVRAMGLAYRYALAGRDLRPPTAAECDGLQRPPVPERAVPELDVPQVLALEGVHFAGPDPFCLETRIINPEAAPRALTHDFRQTAPGAWLRAEVPWTSADHVIRAGARPVWKSPAARCWEPIGSRWCARPIPARCISCRRNSPPVRATPPDPAHDGAWCNATPAPLIPPTVPRKPCRVESGRVQVNGCGISGL